MPITAKYAARLTALYRNAHKQLGIKMPDEREKTAQKMTAWTDMSFDYETELKTFTTALLELYKERGSQYYKKDDLTPTYRALLQLFIDLMQYKAKIQDGKTLSYRQIEAIKKMTPIVNQMLNGRVIETLDGKNFQEDETLSDDSILTATNAVLIEAKKAKAALLGVEPLQENESSLRIQGGRANSGPARKALDLTHLHTLLYPVGSVEHKMYSKIITLNDRIGAHDLPKNSKITPEVVQAFVTLLTANTNRLGEVETDHRYDRYCNNLKSNVLNDFIKLADDLLEDSKMRELPYKLKVTDARLQALQKKFESRFNVNVALRTAITLVISAILFAGVVTGLCFFTAPFAGALGVGGAAAIANGICATSIGLSAAALGLGASAHAFFTGKYKKELYERQRKDALGIAGQDIITTIEAQNFAKNQPRLYP